MIEEEAFYRLRNYPGQIAKNMHHALITLPKKVAYLVRQKASYISSAIEAFYLRDPIALKPLQAQNNPHLYFPVEDLVTVSVTTPRVAYAQIRSQDFQVPEIWKGHIPKGPSRELLIRAESGMKVCCGFEMLLQDPQNQDRREVQEMKMLLEDLQTGDDNLPTDTEIGQWSQQQDDEAWLDVNIKDLEGELAAKRGKEGMNPGGFGDKMAQENLQRLVAQFENFMNDDKEGANGAGLFDEDSDDLEGSSSGESSDGEDRDASFDEDQLSNMMREMMGMPPDAGIDNATIREMVPGVVQELESEGEEETTNDMQTLMARMEAELHESGALNLDANPRKRISKPLADRQERAAADGEAGKPGGAKSVRDEVDANSMRELLEKFRSHREVSGSSRNPIESLDGPLPSDGSGPSKRG